MPGCEQIEEILCRPSPSPDKQMFQGDTNNTWLTWNLNSGHLAAPTTTTLKLPLYTNRREVYKRGESNKIVTNFYQFGGYGNQAMLHRSGTFQIQWHKGRISLVVRRAMSEEENVYPQVLPWSDVVEPQSLYFTFTLAVAHFWGFDKCIKTRIHHYGSMKNPSTALNILCTPPISSPTNPNNHWSFYSRHRFAFSRRSRSLSYLVRIFFRLVPVT